MLGLRKGLLSTPLFQFMIFLLIENSQARILNFKIIKLQALGWRRRENFNGCHQVTLNPENQKRA